MSLLRAISRTIRYLPLMTSINPGLHAQRSPGCVPGEQNEDRHSLYYTQCEKETAPSLPSERRFRQAEFFGVASSFSLPTILRSEDVLSAAFSTIIEPD